MKPWDNENLIQALTHVLERRAESDEREISSVAESLVSHPCTLEDMERQFMAVHAGRWEIITSIL